jgi:hypothetical protein
MFNEENTAKKMVLDSHYGILLPNVLSRVILSRKAQKLTEAAV